MDSKVMLITGGTGSIGLEIVEKLLTDDRKIRVCITGRNPQKIDAVLKIIKLKFPNSECSSVLLDVGDNSSVIKAVKEIRCRFKHIDFVFLNAGVLPRSRVRWLNVLKELFSGKPIHMFLTGEGMLESEKDVKTKDDLPETFATNVFGHYLLVTELGDLLGGRGSEVSQLIWTSSSSAVESAFNPSDIICTKGKDTYASSKRCVDILSVVLNEKLNCRGIYSHVVCPGLVMTNMTNGILPQWAWMLILPFFFLLRVFIGSFTLTLNAGTYGLNPANLDNSLKIFTRAGWFGPYLEFRKIEVDEKTKSAVYDQLADIRKRVEET